MPGLPARPDMGQLRHQAKELLGGALAGEPVALRRTHGVGAPLNLSSAHLLVAREHGFASWARLKQAVEDRSRAGVAPLMAGALGVSAASAVVITRNLGSPPRRQVANGRTDLTWSLVEAAVGAIRTCEGEQ